MIGLESITFFLADIVAPLSKPGSLIICSHSIKLGTEMLEKKYDGITGGEAGAGGAGSFFL